MDPIPSYNLLQAIDPTKIKLPISDRFAKLTLSSNKKKQQQLAETEQQRQQEKRDSVSRDISKQFEEEQQSGQNPLLRSESSKETGGHDSVSADEEELTMDALQVSLDYDNPTQLQEDVELLSQQIASMAVQSRPISLSSGSTCNLSEHSQLVSTESQRSSISLENNIHIVHNIPINVKEAVDQETVAINLNSSNNNELEKGYEMTDDEEEEEEDEAITISDTSESHHEQEPDVMATSSLPSTTLTSENLRLPSLTDNKAERVAAFLRDVSVERRVMLEQGHIDFNDTIDQMISNKQIDKIQETLAKSHQIASADTESMTPDVDEEVTPKSQLEREKRLKALEKSLENEQYIDNNSEILTESEEQISPNSNDKIKNVHRLANDETQDNTVMSVPDVEKTPKVLSNLHRSPKINHDNENNVYRIANDETQCNTEFSLTEDVNERTPKINSNLKNKTPLNKENSRRLANLETEENTQLPTTENKDTDPHRLVNDDTMANSLISNFNDMQQSIVYNNTRDYKTPEKRGDYKNISSISLHSTPQSLNDSGHKQDSLIINSSSESNDANASAPEHSITISETDDESFKEKSPAKGDNSDNKKLSNSFHREESSDDDSEYDEQISQIQMSMAKINISAKINIKIHIPNTTSTETSEDDEQSYEKKRKSQQQNVEWKDHDDDHSSESNDQSRDSSIAEKTCKQMQLKPLAAEQQAFDDDQSSDSNNQSRDSCIAEKPCKQMQLKAQAPPLVDGIENSPNKSSDSVEIVEDENFLKQAHKILTQVYGESWQTPDVMRCNPSSDKNCSNSKTSSLRKNEIRKSKEKKSNHKVMVEESILDDFSLFRRNIVKTNLDSTRLATPKTAKQNKEVSTEPRNFKKPFKKNEKADTKFMPQTERKAIRTPVAKVVVNKGRVTDGRWRQLIDNDSNSESNNASDDDDADESWSKNASEIELDNSDSDFENSPKPKARNRKTNTTKRQGRSDKSDILTKKLNKSKEGEIVYLDLSKEEVEVQDDVPESPPANHDVTFASRLQDILKTCRHEDKAKLPSSNKKTKRKLFTPNFGDDDEIDLPVEDAATKYKENTPKTINRNIEEGEILDDKGFCPFDSRGRPKALDLVNKQLESVKTGKPIFQLTPSPKKKGSTKKTDKNANTQGGVTPKTKTDNEAKFKTPLTVKSKGPKSLHDLCQTPDYKYNFLKSLDVTVSKTLCHPDALYYRDNYRTKKEDLSKILYDMYNEKLFKNQLNVPITWNKKLSNTAGRCLNKKKLGLRSSVIELSDKVLTSGDRLRCTLIHELCHAATWIFNGEGGHGSTWKEWARRANATFPEIPKIGVCHQYDIEYKYTYKCTLCAAKSHAHSKSKKVENIRCSYCHGAIEVFLNKKDKAGNIIPTPVKEATGFAKFVKDNYKKFKRDDRKHADVMKLLSSEFASLKVANN
ncbi:germ cell nuclear acidic protein [Calliphora vicina]|uniref:germ cell nuclear acidic protein n=1 Tax=Calliphora vicina TaxID=7373 RepID=UPI00325C28D5